MLGPWEASGTGTAESYIEKGKASVLLLQIVLYYLLFFLLVKGAARNSGLNCLYFYSKPTWKRHRNGGLRTRTPS